MFLTFSLLDENEEWRLVPPLVCSVRGRGLSVSSIAGSDAADIRTIDRWSITACRCAESKQFYYLWVFILRFEWIETQSTTETRQTFNFKLWKSLTFRSIIVSFLEFVVCPTHSNRKVSHLSSCTEAKLGHKQETCRRASSGGRGGSDRWCHIRKTKGKEVEEAEGEKPSWAEGKDELLPSILEDHERRRHSARH